MRLTLDVAKNVEDFSFSSIPNDVKDRAKLLILDNLGCTIAGSRTESAGKMLSYLRRVAADGVSKVWGTPFSFDSANAAHANAHFASVLSLDDSYIQFGHPGSSIIPAAVAVAAEIGSTGEQLLTAIIGGYEMSLRLGSALRPSTERDARVQGYATWQIYGACTASCILHRLETEQVADAYGIVATHAQLPFLRKFHSQPMCELKNNYGWANKAAIVSVDLARAGFNGNRTIFDGEDGFWMMAGSDRFDPDKMLARWQDRYFVREVGFKPFAVCRWIHTTIDCVRSLMSEYGITHRDVKLVRVETANEFVEEFTGEWPTTTTEAAFHIPYAVSLELHEKTSANGLSSGSLSDQAIHETGKRVQVEALSGGDEKFRRQRVLPAQVTMFLSDGRTVSRYSELPSGAPDGPPYGQADVVDKFLRLSVPILGQRPAESLADDVLSLEAFDSSAMQRSFLAHS